MRVEEKIDHFQIVSIFRSFFWIWGSDELGIILGPKSTLYSYGIWPITNHNSQWPPAPAQFNQSHPPQNPLYSLVWVSDPIQFQSKLKMREQETDKLRAVVRDCVTKHLYSSAIFFADKVAAFTKEPADIYMLAQALFLGRHYRRAFHLLHSSKIVDRDLRFRYLAAKCLVTLAQLGFAFL